MKAEMDCWCCHKRVAYRQDGLCEECYAKG